MKKKSLLFIAAAGVSFAAFAYTWTGGGNDGGLWTNPQNWGVTSGYPSTTDDVVIFDGNATVSLDTGAQTDIAYINVKSGTVVLTATEGSSLKIARTGHSVNGGGVNACGLTIAAGATLDLSAPLAPLSTRFDKWGAGTLIVRDIDIKKTDDAAWYLYQGTNSFEGTVSVSQPSSDFVVGVGSPYAPIYTFIKDGASISVKKFSLSAGGSTVPNTKIVQDGAGTAVVVSEKLELEGRANDDGHCYTLKAGTLASPLLSVSGRTGSALYNPTNLHYVQEGGTSTFATVTLNGGSAALRGGVMNFTGADADFSVPNGGTFALSGGLLAWPRSFNPVNFPMIRWSGKTGVTVPAGATFTWDWSRSDVAEGTVFVHDGDGTLTFLRAKSTEGVGLEIAAGKMVTVDSNSTLSAPLGSSDPWKLTINDGATFRLLDNTARLSVPLDLTVNGSGKILFNNHRGAAVAHRLTVDGEEKAKGIYWASGNSFVDGTLAAVVVPHVWTGAGDGVSWTDAANWDDNTVPNGTAEAADISRATTITLDSAVSLGFLAALPTAAGRKVTVTGNGTISLSAPYSYSCGMIVPQGCELVLGVNFSRTSNNLQGMAGGGKLTLTKTLPSAQASSAPLFAINGTLALKGVQTLVPVSGSTYNFLTLWTYEGTDSELLIEDGTVIDTKRFVMSHAGYGPLSKVRQTGGSVTFNNNSQGGDCCYIQSFNANRRYCQTYFLEGGTLTIDGPMLLGRSALTANNNRQPGGSFEMSGGTLTVKGFIGGFNQNYVRLYGGDVYLTGDSSAAVDKVDAIGELDQNTYTFYLGGAMIHPTGVYWIKSGNIWLTGRNGDVTFDVTQSNMAIDKGNTIAGPGGFTVAGPNGRTLTAKGTYTHTGCVRVSGGANLDFSDSTLNGPTAFVVDHASSKLSIIGSCTVAKSPERIELAAASCLGVADGKSLTVKRLTVGGVDYAAGTYTFGSGSVTVEARAGSWLDGAAGDLSYEADGATQTLTEATTLASLVYAPIGAAGQTNTLAGAAVVFSDGANIHVRKGDTLVVGNDVVLAGKVTKTGEGEVVFNGGVTCSGAPGAENDTGWLTVTEGGATFDGAVTGVRLVTCGTKTLPVITLGSHCSVTDYAIVLTAWSEGNAEANVLGETRQNGATVDYSAGVFPVLLSGQNDQYPMAKPNGGEGRWMLNGGTFRGNASLHLSFMNTAVDHGTFAFVQSGGTFILPRSLFFARATYGLDLTYTIKGGRAEFAGYPSGYSRTMNFYNFDGGTVVFKGTSGASFADRANFTMSVGGDVTFETDSATRTVYFPNDYTGDGAITFNGGGFLFSGAVNVSGLNVQTGSVTLGESAQRAATGGTALTVSKTATLNLDYDGEMPFKTLKVGSHGRAEGTYSTMQGPAAVRNVLHGNGKLLILEGSAPGSVLSIR